MTSRKKCWENVLKSGNQGSELFINKLHISTELWWCEFGKAVVFYYFSSRSLAAFKCLPNNLLLFVLLKALIAFLSSLVKYINLCARLKVGLDDLRSFF